MKLDTKKWNETRKELEKNIKEFKKRQRERFQPNWKHGPDDWTMKDMKNDATSLYAVRAACRGRQHCEKINQEDALKLLPEYAISVSEAA